MRVDQYTPDAICQAMGMGGFVGAGWAEAGPPALRILLMPSCYPEVCITLTKDDAGPIVEAVAFEGPFWPESFPRRMPAHLERAPFPRRDVEVALSDLLEARDEILRAGKMVYLDGMGMACGWVEQGRVERFEAHVSGSTPRRFVGRIVRRTWEVVQSPRIRNALARCGRYVGEKLPIEPAPEPISPTWIMMLGEPDAKSDLMSALEAVATRNNRC